MGEFPGSTDYFVDESRVFVNQNSSSAIVIHGTGGNPDQTVEQLGDWFRSPANTAMTSSHFGIDRAGRIAQYVCLSDGACANCCVEWGHDPFWDQFGGDNLNWHTISIEHVNNASNSLPLTSAQQEASFKLVKWICNRYNIPITNIKSHASIAPQSRARCPGMFPWEQLWAFLKEGTGMLDLNDPVVQMFFTDGGNGTWKCKKNNFIIGHGILNFYQKFGGDAFYGLTHLGLPLSNEIGDPNHRGVVIQEFERATVRYDPSHLCDMPPGSGGVYLIHIEQDPRYMQLQTHIATLQQSVLAKELQTEQAKLAQIKQIASS